MWSTIENFRESLSQITSEVLDVAEELEGGGSEQSVPSPGSGSEAPARTRPRQLSLIDGRPEGDDGYTSQQNGKENYVVKAQSVTNGFLPKLKELQVHNKKLLAREKDISKELSEKNLALVSIKQAHGKMLTELSTLKELLMKEREEFSSVKTQLHRERKLAEEANKENERLKLETEKMLLEKMELQQRLVEQSAEINKMRDSSRAEAFKEMESILTTKDEKAEQLQALVHEMENRLLQLEAEVDVLRQRENSGHILPSKDPVSNQLDTASNNESKQVLDASKAMQEIFEHEKVDYEKRLTIICAERDKAVRDLKRLKQHLLEKEQADSKKMEQDSQHIRELEEKADASMVRAMRLEQNLAQALQRQGEHKEKSGQQLEEANQEIASLRKKLAACLNASESKDHELQNLQAALGQYYAECEAKDRLQAELISTRKEVDKLSDQLESVNNAIVVKDTEKEELLERFKLQQKKVSESQEQSHKLEADVLMLRRALEQSLTRLNRMSSDSDFYVDRRIVIKLLVTFFQRQQSREVLDLMSRMLGFSEEDKQLLGLVQQPGKGVVRGVLGLPGRFVGGLLKTSSSPVASASQHDDQSFSDLWIDFLLKESEEREKRDGLAAESSTLENSLPSSSPDAQRFDGAMASNKKDHHLNADPYSSPDRSRGLSTFENGPTSRYHGSESVGSEFSNVPLNSSPSPSLGKGYF